MERCSCYHQHGSKFVCYGTKEMEECSCGGDESKCNFYPEKRKQKPMTNADRIRAMSDEELSVFLWNFDLQEIAREGFAFITRRKVIEWLKIPVED